MTASEKQLVFVGRGQAALAWQQNRTVGGGGGDNALAQYTSQYNYIIYGIHMQSIYVFGLTRAILCATDPFL